MRGVRLTGRFHARRRHGRAGGRLIFRTARRPARRAGVIVAALMTLPMVMGAVSSTGKAPLPSAAGVRGAVVRLVDWVTGKTPPPPHVPRQQEGKAPGRQRQVPAAVTRAVARAEGRAPGKGAGQLPTYVFHPATVRRYVTGTAHTGGPGSFSQASSKLMPSGTTATSDLYRNADGSYTRMEHLAPVNGSGKNTGRLTLASSGPAGVGVKGTRVTSASLRVLEAWNGECPAPATVTVSDVSGQRVGVWSGKPPASACGSGSQGTWIAVPLSSAGLRALGSGRSARLTVTVTPAPASPSPAASPSPVLEVTAASGTPQVNGQWPPDGYNSPTLTPEMIASASDADGDTLQYDFTLYNADGSTLDSTGWASSDDGMVPSGDLAWDKTYYWTVQASDGTNTSPDPQIFSLSTPVPQPLVASGFGRDGAAPAGQTVAASTGGQGTAAPPSGQDGAMPAGQASSTSISQNDMAPSNQASTTPGGQGSAATGDVAGSAVPGFNPQDGNFTAQATDVNVAVVGPALTIQRTYNSLNPNLSGAFGAGWSSVLDMTVSAGPPGASGPSATEDVTLADGQQVVFGLNSDGTYTPPQGQYGTLAPMTGGFELVDKNDAIYKFTRSLGSGRYAVTELNDPMGHALDLTYSSSGQITQITSAASHRSLYLTWSTPSGASFPHVTSVSTDPVTPGNSASAITWQYDYSGDELTAACNESESGQPCTSYTYQTGSDYPATVLNSGPQSYWRLNEDSGTTAASSVLANEGADNATYSNVVQDVRQSPLAGTTAAVGAAGFNGTGSSVRVPANLADDASAMSVSLWFNTTAANGVLLSQSADPITSSTTTNPYSPVLYIGADGSLFGGFGDGGNPLYTSGSVNDGKWHNVVLTSDGSTEILYLDGAEVASQSAPGTAFIEPFAYLGAGFLGGSYPDEPDQGQTAAAAYYDGALSDAATWDRPLTAAEVSGLYAAGTSPAALLTKTTRPSGKIFGQQSYNPVTSGVTNVTDSDGGSWTVGAPAVTGSSQVYVAAVKGAQPEDYWRLADTGTTTAVNQVNVGAATYNDVTQGVSGGPFSDTTVDGFNGSSSFLALPDGQIGPGNQSVSLWFKTTATDGVLLSSSVDPVTDSTTANSFTPNLYIGQDGDLNGEFFYDDAPISSGTPVNDGKWHNIVLAAGSGSQTLYLDGEPIGSASGTITGGYSDGEDNVDVGAGFLGGVWADQPHYSTTDPTGYQSFFAGDIAEVAFYPEQLSAASVTAEWVAAHHSPGLTPVQNDKVTDPGSHTLAYAYDPLNSERILSFTDGLGDTTSYGYDSGGFLDSVVDPNGDVTYTGYDVRGNSVSQTTCQDQAAGQCSTSYYTYSPNDTSATLSAPYSANDEVMTSSDPRSSSPSDTTYQTTNLYSSTGELLSTTTPPVPGFPSGRTTSYAYTDGTTTAGDTDGTTIVPGGLLWKTTSPGGAVTKTLYDADGDVAETVNADGLITDYAYDGIGRRTSRTVYSDTYPGGLTTTYSYDAYGRVIQQADPPVTDHVTGDVHTPRITTSYDADGDVLSRTTADTTGGDASRTVSYTYDGYDQKASSTDAAGAVTYYSYDAYGNLGSETDPAGNETIYSYDPDGRLLTTTLWDYTGSPPGSQAAAPLTEESRAYDPAGRLASVTDAMGRVTSYAYTDNGLTAKVTRSGPGAAPAGGSSVEEADTYDVAGNLVTKVTGNGATTTDYAVDAADQVTSQTVDPAGLDRVTSYAYDADGHVITRAVAQGSGPAVQTTSYTYDAMGNKTSQMIDDPGAEGPDGWWTLTQSSGTAVADTSGTGNTATASPGVTWTGGGAQFSGQQEITTRGPVVDTTGSFSVSAWVDLAGLTGNDQSAISQDAGSVAGFYLGLDSGTGTWKFTRPEEDENDPPDWATADSGVAAQTGTWTFLTGVFSANTQTVRLYVNGAAAGSAPDPSPIAASGPLEIGSGKYDGQQGAAGWDGSLTNVEAYPTALSATEVSNLYGQGRGGGDLTRDNLTTSYQVDELGQTVARTDPDEVTTSYTYDEAGRLAVTTGPPMATETGGGTPVVARPVSVTGYDTFGDATETEDPDGNVTTYTYDADGRQLSQTLPSYTPPGASAPVNGTSTTAYNSLGEVTSQTDPDGNTTTFGYDQLGDVTSQTGADGGVTAISYDADREILSQTGPTGAQVTGTYDYLGRPITSTQVERHPSSASYTTTISYAPTTADPSGTWKSSVTTPDGVTASYGYDAAGETTQLTDGAGNTTKYSYDALGRKTATVNPDGTSRTVSYDPAGNVVAQSSLSASGQTLTTQTATYNGEGQQLSTTDARGDTTAYTYDPLGDLTSETQPVTSSSGIITSFGYDAAGNQTRYTDGNGNNWTTAYNSWNLPESQVEPATSQYTSPASTTTTTAYNGDGLPATVTQPGGVTVTDSYDNMNDLTGQTGSGATAPTATRSFTYDDAGDMLTAATSSTAASGQASNATSETFTYDDRGLPLTASGSAGSTSFSYNGDGLQASVQDAAGTSAYTYDGAGRLATMSDPASGTTLSYSYNDMSQVSAIAYGSGGDTQSYAYNNLHELTSDTLASSGGTTVASIAYAYNPDGNITSKTTTGFAGAAANAYTYDQAGRLTSWDNGTTTTGYAYDANGNRTQAGSATYTYDARDELTSDGTSTYSYSANGDLSSVTGSSGTVTSTSDAYGQQGSQGSQADVYDALGRDVQTSVTGGATANLSYEGTTGQLTSDGTSDYTWTPDGTLTGTETGGSGVLDLTDQHTDVVGQFTASGTSLTGSRTFGPWGSVSATGGTVAGSLGYQSQYTSPATGQTDMGARWYNPANGGFGNKDTVSNNPTPNSASASPYGYAGDNPLGNTDPTGHWGIPGLSTVLNGLGDASDILAGVTGVLGAADAAQLGLDPGTDVATVVTGGLSLASKVVQVGVEAIAVGIGVTVVVSSHSSSSSSSSSSAPSVSTAPVPVGTPATATVPKTTPACKTSSTVSCTATAAPASPAKTVAPASTTKNTSASSSTSTTNKNTSTSSSTSSGNNATGSSTGNSSASDIENNTITQRIIQGTGIQETPEPATQLQLAPAGSGNGGGRSVITGVASGGPGEPAFGRPGLISTFFPDWRQAVIGGVFGALGNVASGIQQKQSPLQLLGDALAGIPTGILSNAAGSPAVSLTSGMLAGGLNGLATQMIGNRSVNLARTNWWLLLDIALGGGENWVGSSAFPVENPTPGNFVSGVAGLDASNLCGILDEHKVLDMGC